MNTASLAKSFEDDGYYIKVQAEHNDVSIFWSQMAVESSTNFISLLGPNLYDDDVIADFGSRSGYVADNIKSVIHQPVICIDINPTFIEECQAKGHEGYVMRLEDMSKLPDHSIDWGFCSHTLEHVKDFEAAVKELNRVVKRGLFLVMPLEDHEDPLKNPSHMRYSMDPHFYTTPFENLGWTAKWHMGADPEGRIDYQVWLVRE